ncbi:MAG: hypothetical protein P0S94_03330 [Simkaniaceae bacterium]|nr:hypothetical protein [Simkaniaceae bacterium]
MIKFLLCFAITALFAKGAPSATTSKKDPIAPWFTGPILAPAGQTIPKDHINWEPYLYITDNLGVYDHQWHHHTGQKSATINPLLSWTAGLTDFMDLQIIPQFLWNIKDGQQSCRFGDLSVYLGFQLMNEELHTWKPSLRFTLQEVFPTGHYNHLDPDKLGTDASGSGSFQSGFGFNFQKLFIMWDRYLRLRLNLIAAFPSKVEVEGFNSFGGGFGTDGQYNLGNRYTGILAFEYAVTQNWVLAMDSQFVWQGKDKFKGTPGVTTTGAIADNGVQALSQISLAPAIEYNWSANIGVIAGAWFSVRGRNSADFAGASIALNYYH